METQQKKSKTKVIAGVIVALVIVLVGGLYYWHISSQYESTDNAQLDGNLEPIRASVTAYLDTIYFKDNQIVKRGDTLMKFNVTALNARVQQAEAALESASVGVKVSGSRAVASAENANASQQLSQLQKQDILAAKANLEQAQSDFNRTTELLKIKAATSAEMDAARTRLQVATANYAQAVGRQQSSVVSTQGLTATSESERSQVGSATALVKQREAELALAKEDLKHAVIIAPTDGIVTKRSVNQGQYVTTGSSLCTVVDQSNLWVSANLKETQVNKIREGQEVEISVDAYPNLKLKGHVSSFGGATGARFSLLPPDNATGNFIKIVQRFPIRINLDPITDKAQQLYPGLSVDVKIKVK